MRIKVQNELDLQRTVSQEFSQTSQQVNKAINQKIDAINSELEKGNLSDAEKTKLETQRDNWQYSKYCSTWLPQDCQHPPKAA